MHDDTFKGFYHIVIKYHNPFLLIIILDQTLRYAHSCPSLDNSSQKSGVLESSVKPSQACPDSGPHLPWWNSKALMNYIAGSNK